MHRILSFWCGHNLLRTRLYGSQLKDPMLPIPEFAPLRFRPVIWMLCTLGPNTTYCHLYIELMLLDQAILLIEIINVSSDGEKHIRPYASRDELTQ